MYNFALLDENSKREIRRAVLKAIAIPGFQVPFASRELPDEENGAPPRNKRPKTEIGVAGIYFLILMPHFEFKVLDDHFSGLGSFGQPCFDG